MTGYRQPTTLRVQVSLCGALLGRAGHRTMLHLSAAGAGIEKRNPLFDKLLLYEIPTPRKLEIQPHATGGIAPSVLHQESKNLIQLTNSGSRETCAPRTLLGNGTALSFGPYGEVKRAEAVTTSRPQP